MRAIGIDVSTYQDNSQTTQRIDWTKPKNKNVVFVINRATIDVQVDQDFYYNWGQQKINGLLRGDYGFWDYRLGARTTKEQALFYVATIKSVDKGEIPVHWMDFEQANSSWPVLPPREKCLTEIETYMKTVEDGLGEECGLYTRPSHIKYNLSVFSGDKCVTKVPDWLRAKKLWVAAWPTGLPGMTLEEYIEKYAWKPNLYDQWEEWFLWQYGTPAEGKEMGMESLDIDKNFFKGTEEELRSICKSGGTDVANIYKEYSLGYYTKTATWTNPGFGFICGWAGESYKDPNPELKPIELKTAGENKPFIAVYDFNADEYIRAQYPMDKDLWPSLEKDHQYQMFVRALTSRDVQGVVVRIMNQKDHDNKTISPAWISFAADLFVGRANDWVLRNKPKAKFFVASSNAFISSYAPNMNNWIGKYNSFIDSPVTTLDASYPLEADKPQHLDNRVTWEMWNYRPSLVLFNGKPDKLQSFFGLTSGSGNGDNNDGGGGTSGSWVTKQEFLDLKAEFDSLKSEVESEIATIKVSLNSVKGDAFNVALDIEKLKNILRSV